MPVEGIGRSMRAVLLLTLFLSFAAFAADPNKVLRVASPDIDTFDPQQYNDNPSFEIQRAIFESLYEWDYLASPPKLSPLTAAAPVEITDGGRTWTIRLRPGIYFTDDPAFHGQRRELVAADYVYSLKRWLDPNLRRGGAAITTDLIAGAREVVDAARKPGASFDYDRSIEGLRALDRYTLQLKLREPNYPVIQAYLTTSAVAREVVEAASGDIRARAVGTGPYRLREWKRGSRVLLEANPAYRPVHFPESNDPAMASLVRSMRGKTLPQIGSIEVLIIDEYNTRMLEFERGRLDYIVTFGDTANRLLAGDKLRPELAAKGVKRLVYPEAYVFSFYFNVADPVIGGMSKERVALRRAIAMGIDTAALVQVVYGGQALPANQMVPPGVAGHDPTLPAKPSFDPAGANALLDRFGYGKRDGDGYRQASDGTRLTLNLTLRSGAVSREVQTLAKKNLDALGLRLDFHITPFQEAIKELEAGEFQMYFGGYGGNPSGYAQLMQLYGKQPPTVNVTRFRLPDYDREMERFLRSPDETEQIAAARRMSELSAMYVPALPAIFRLENDFAQPWVLGFAPQRFDVYWKYLDIDLARQRQAQR